MTIHFTSPISSTTTTTVTSIATGTERLMYNQLHHHQQDDKNDDEYESLLPGLSDHIAQLCLSLVPPSLLFSVCRSWRRLIYSPSFPPYLSIYAFLLSTSPAPEFNEQQQQQPHLSNSINFSSFDPISSSWQSISQPPLNILLNHPSFIFRRLPIQSVTVSGNIAVLAATSDDFIPALSRPLIFNPLSQNWYYGPPFTVPRRWCAAGSSDGTVYIAGGIGSHYNSEVSRSVEKWDLKNKINGRGNNKRKRSSSCDANWKWEKLEGLRDGKFSREAIDAIGWRRKLCMVNVKGRAAKEGIIYNIKDDAWEEMPDGMLMGWRGPAAAMEEDSIFMVDEFKGILKKYDPKMDLWQDIYEDILLKDAQHVAAACGRVCVVCSGGISILVVDVTVVPPCVQVVETPQETEAIAIHILPRMSNKNPLIYE